MSAESDALTVSARALTKETTELRETVESLETEYRRLAPTVKQNSRRGRLLVIAVVISFILGAAVAWIALDNRRLNAAQSAQAERFEHVIQDALCPTYDLSIGGYNPNTRDPDPEAQAAYRAAIEKMIEYRRVFQCKGELVPPRLPGS